MSLCDRSWTQTWLLRERGDDTSSALLDHTQLLFSFSHLQATVVQTYGTESSREKTYIVLVRWLSNLKHCCFPRELKLCSQCPRCVQNCLQFELQGSWCPLWISNAHTDTHIQISKSKYWKLTSFKYIWVLYSAVNILNIAVVCFVPNLNLSFILGRQAQKTSICTASGVCWHIGICPQGGREGLLCNIQQ